MPKRIIDGEAMWTSSKIASVDPPDLRTHYAWLLPLAMANGVFEADPALVRSHAYSFCWPDFSAESVSIILDEFSRRKLLFRWKTPDGKQWGYWVGIDKPGRLPGVSRRGTNERIGPNPDPEALSEFLNEDPHEKLSPKSAHGCILHPGSGLGSGLGSGVGGAAQGAAPARARRTPASKRTAHGAMQAAGHGPAATIPLGPVQDAAGRGSVETRTERGSVNDSPGSGPVETPERHDSTQGAISPRTEHGSVQKTATARTRFVPPTVAEITAYMQERQVKEPLREAQMFFDHFETRGWRPKGYTVPMRDWKAAVRTWIRHMELYRSGNREQGYESASERRNRRNQEATDRAMAKLAREEHET
jgi:hypothetical protein